MVTNARATRLISFNDMLSSAFLKRPKGHPPLPEFGPSLTLVGPNAPLITGCCGGSFFFPPGRIAAGTFPKDRKEKMFIFRHPEALGGKKQHPPSFIGKGPGARGLPPSPRPRRS